MTTTDKEDVEDSLNLKISIHNIMCTFTYSNTSEFSGHQEGMINEETYKITIRNMYKIGWKANYFKSADVSMLVHGCGVLKYSQFYERTKNIYQVLPRLYVGSYSVEKGRQFL